MTCTVTVLPAGRKLSAQPGENLLTLLRSANLAPEAPCGGNGKCGKCTVLIGGKPVLACGYTVSGDVTVHVTAAKTHARILTDGYGAEVELQPLRDGAMAAFDIGTTTVVCYLLEAGTGHLLAAASAVNPQQSYGADVISRIQRALAGEMEAQTRLIREQMGSLLGDACRQAGVLPETVGVISVVGNPCMQQLFLGIMPENLAKIPFAPVLTKAEVGEAGDIFPCCPHAALVTVPDISGYVGADTVGCVLASGLDREEKRTLLVDIGTLIAQALGVPESVIALTFVALGTSLPELVTAITSLAKGHGSLSLGNVIGANVFNLVLVSGMSITVSPFSIPQNSTIMGINSSLVMDLPVMFAVMLLLTVPALLKGRLSRWQGVLLLCIYAAFCAVQFAM